MRHQRARLRAAIAGVVIVLIGWPTTGFAQVVPDRQAGDLGPAPLELPKIPQPDPAAAMVPEGFRVEIVAQGLTYPTSIAFDDQGNIFVAEAGYNYGDPIAPARVHRLGAEGSSRVVVDQLSGPVTDLMWHEGRLYISHRGKISALESDGTVRDLITDLPSWGDHHNNAMSVGPDGKIYFGQGTATNSGVVGVDNFQHGWLAKSPNFHDRPAYTIRIRGTGYPSPNPFAAVVPTEQPAQVVTSAFQAFGRTVPDGTVIPGTTLANGTILRMNPDGSELEVYAWGLRNPFGVGWSPDGKLYVTDAGYDERGSRPIANAPDCLWTIERGAWYGFPDFAGGIPVTDPRFHSPRGPAPQFLMLQHPQVERPAMSLPPHTGAAKFDFSQSPDFGATQMYVALAGDMVPMTGGSRRHPGYRVVRINTRTLEMVPFFYTRRGALGPQGLEYVATAGPKRPVDVAFSPQRDALYVVDLGAMTTMPTAAGPMPQPFPNTGVVWRITRGGPQEPATTENDDQAEEID